MTYEETLLHFGTQVRIAAALGISQPTVSQWGGVIPDAYQYQLEVITDGKLKVDERLRVPANAAIVQQTATHAHRRQMS